MMFQIGIIASVTLPKFVNFKTTAILKQEDYVIGALISAVQAKAMQNLSQGSEPDNAFPNVNPFSLLEQAPPNRSCGWSESITSDGTTWHYSAYGGQQWLILRHTIYDNNERGVANDVQIEPNPFFLSKNVL